MCATWGHEEVPAVRYVSCGGEGAHPYCRECSDVLLNGDEIDRGPVGRITDEMVDCAAKVYADIEDPRGGRGDRVAMRAALEAALGQKERSE